MIAMSIVGLLLTQALPNFSAWIHNLQIRNNTEAILNGLQLARAQALRSNTNTELVLIAAGTAPVAANVGVAADPNGTNWIVRNYQSTGVYTAADFVQGRSWQEGSKNPTVDAVVVAGPGSGVASGGPWIAGSYVFTPLGRLLNPPPAVSNINVDSPNAYSNKRPMRIVVSTGGQILMCDPNPDAKIANPNNPQFC